MKKHNFTIVELLIAMGLMMFVATLLSKIYARVSEHSVNMVADQNIITKGHATMTILSKDFSVSRICNGGTGLGSRTMQLLSSFADLHHETSPEEQILADKFMDSSNVRQTNPIGYPYLVMTAVDNTFSNEDIMARRSDGFKEVGYWAVPNDRVNDRDGKVSKLMSLLRLENHNDSQSLFDNREFDVYSDNVSVLLDNLVAISYSFGQLKLDNNNAAENSRVVSFNNDPNPISSVINNERYVFYFDESSKIDMPDPSPDYVDILFSVLNQNNEIIFASKSGSYSINESFENIDLDDDDFSVGAEIPIDDIAFIDRSNYIFPPTGHFWIPDEGAVLHYRVDDSGSLFVTRHSGCDVSGISINSDSTVYVTTPFFKRIFLK